MRNELNQFGYLEPTSVSNAVSLLTKYGGKARVVAGGTDLMNQMKNQLDNLTPEYLIDLTGLNLSGITYSGSSGLTVGATTTVDTIKNDANVKQYYPALAQAATGHPVQIANMGTIAGNVSQEVWCWYLRNNYDCWRNGGTVCYAINGDNRYYHSLFGGNLCYAVHAGDLSAPLMALDATLTVQGPNGTSTKTMEQFFPGVTTVDGRIKENSLRYNEIITKVNIPVPASGTQQSYFRITDRIAIDFPMASAAAVVKFNGSTVSSAKIVLGHVATHPIRAPSAESYIVGKQLTESVIAEAAQKAFAGATPLSHTATNQSKTGANMKFRTYIGAGAVINALRSLPGATPGVVPVSTS